MEGQLDFLHIYVYRVSSCRLDGVEPLKILQTGLSGFRMDSKILREYMYNNCQCYSVNNPMKLFHFIWLEAPV
jgi:hypothetical protein